jgi:small nuclear ribonucleoprotein (snRNP)-like protein
MLSNVEEIIDKKENKKFQLITVRGDLVVLISPIEN